MRFRESSSPKAKHERMLRGERPRVLDLFAGCGGMSLGFEQAGADVVAGLEVEAVRAKTHARNFHQGDPRHAAPRDVTTQDPRAYVTELLGRDGQVDVIVGGPPCQAYARVGRAKLREIAQHPEAYLRDERGQLYASYVRYVEELRPVAVLMENVPDILSYGGANVAELAAEGLEALGYECRYTLLNAANYGVPQTRERWYMVGVHRDVGVAPTFPSPTHHVELPSGYRGTRSRALAWDLAPDPHCVPLRAVPTTLPSAVSCAEALSDLPYLGDVEKRALKRGVRDLGARRPYHHDLPQNPYQQAMRTRRDGSLMSEVSAHVIRSLPRDYATFRAMREGDDYPAAYAAAERLLRERVDELVALGYKIPEGGARWEELRREIVPPYDPTKFPNKWRKLERNFPSRTLMAHLSHDTYSHIHYDGRQARTVSVREAARLQSFPDWFEFCGAMNAAFGQIGNAVPPRMARALAGQLFATLGMQMNAPALRAVGDGG
jgi:DNA (cytosine-5)-methyltransferase 1